MPQEVLIKRYANRRLYDTNTSSYVTLSQVGDMVRQGLRVQVVEANTGEEVTAYVLAQIVLEEAKKKNILLPAPVLHLVIRYGDSVLGDFFEKYFQEAIKSYVSYKIFADEQFRKWLGAGIDLSQMTQETAGEMNPFKTFFNSLFESEEEESGGK